MIHQKQRTATLLVVGIAILGTTLTGCGRFASVFYSQKNPQAIQRDTIDASGNVRSGLTYADFKGNGVVRIVPLESLGAMDSVTISVSPQVKQSVSVFQTPRKLYLPSGFTAEVIASGLGQPHDIEVRNDGTLFVSDFGGKIYAVSPTGSTSVIATGLSSPHGIELADGKLFYSDVNSLYRYDFSSPTSTEGTAVELTDKLPKGGVFYSRTITYRPEDKNIYISVGATTFDGVQDRDHGTLFRISPEGGNLNRVLMTGLRNTMAMDVNPVTGDLWGIDQGMDNLAEQLAPDEVNILKPGAKFGHPYYYSQNFVNPKFESPADQKNAIPPVMELEPNGMASDLVFYMSDALGSEWKNAMIVVQNGLERGSVTRSKELRTGFRVLRVRSERDGSNGRQANFISGWLSPTGDFWGQPAGVAVAPDGRTFYVTDSRNGVVYKFTKS